MKVVEIFGLLVLVGIAAFTFRWLWQMLAGSEKPARLLIKWLATIVLAYGIVKSASLGPFAPIIGAVLGLVLAVMWAPSIGGLVAKPFSALYDGGEQEIEAQPLYSMAESRRKRGDYQGAMNEVQKQLERFPSDFTGLMMLAEIQADELKNLAGARETIEMTLGQEGHSPKNVAYALNRLADWELKLAGNPVGARSALNRIIELLPESESAQLAHQRVAHLQMDPAPEHGGEPRRFVLKHIESSLGLRDQSEHEQASYEGPAEAAARCVKRLDEHPHDYEAREMLATIYADQYQRLDLASDQLEFLIAAPHQPNKQIVRWLNLLADFQVRLTGGVDEARETLNRIVENFPNSAAAENARNRIARLNLEVRSKQASQVVRLGSYEQNIGLKGRKLTE